MDTIADVQSSVDKRNMPINQVGVKGLRLPLSIISAAGEQHTVADLTMTVALPAEQKGTHMSRFIELMLAQQGSMDFAALQRLTGDMLLKLQATAGRISIRFPFFRRKLAPVTAISSLLDYEVMLSGEILAGVYQHSLQVVIPVTSLCPCSKEISAYGAHNQRSHVTVTLISTEAVAIEEIIDLVEQQGSCQLYGLLKRPDEKYVTEYAYDNPKFVEDMVRDVATALKADARIQSFTVESENFESIHNHSAYALIQYP
ncbi:MAG: GTP cyclohydrolase I FolE2 [Snodgrassella sp.]|uniref:GTP cyclohydrolase FolE2 n=1 Tax=Snodgrassella sp. TaxID=2815304 RepID=UPI002586E896|nr:GTP cyclohydrolase FolE2 [Snodgrassella sp.]MCO6508202.1 GTP cyclohydrolase I FolE2 [Snodgrassella sp.]MCO6513418.1 GTP cyclohydrolase I FolE2 [Snodgrassella sp.]MCO6515155.1 GTP cyclohydrolase I FolE2 [Snodgrassella sp.]MCO6518572.1 GTP cyclohydrolase I FolE2 [Snodgrassella sp.]MCO6521188.1 GTP cyclohydrolase I FolE2 [Snodgrassella sp.]